MALLLISHDLGVMADAVQRMLVMYGGTVVESGPTARSLRAARASVHARPVRRPAAAGRWPRGTRLATIAGRVPELAEMPPGCPFADRCELRHRRLPRPRRRAPVRGRTRSHRRRAACGVDAVRAGSGRMTDRCCRSRTWTRRYRLPRESLLAPPPEVQALAGVSFTLHAGRSLGVVGESGSGKSTLARLVMALDAPTAGRVLLDGVDLHRARRRPRCGAARADFQMVFQDPFGSLDPRRTVLQTVAEPLALLQGADRSRATRAGARRRSTPSACAAADLAQVPARIQRRPAPAHRDRARADHAAEADRRRRAGQRARRVSVQAQVLNLMQDLQDRFGVTYLLHQPRPGGGRPGLRRGDRAAPGPHRRAGQPGAAVPRAATSLHAPPAGRGAGHRRRHRGGRRGAAGRIARSFRRTTEEKIDDDFPSHAECAARRCPAGRCAAARARPVAQGHADARHGARAARARPDRRAGGSDRRDRPLQHPRRPDQDQRRRLGDAAAGRKLDDGAGRPHLHLQAEEGHHLSPTARRSTPTRSSSASSAPRRRTAPTRRARRCSTTSRASRSRIRTPSSWCSTRPMRCCRSASARTPR